VFCTWCVLKALHSGREPPCFARRSPALLGESGDSAELATLRHRHLFAPDSPAMLGSLKADPDQRPQLHPVDPRHAWMLLRLILTFQSALSEPSTAGPARAKRRGCLSVASSRAVPRRAEERRAPVRNAHRLVTGGTFLLVTFLCVQRKVTPMNGEAPSARATRRKPASYRTGTGILQRSICPAGRL
jgi:hypothetical protein